MQWMSGHRNAGSTREPGRRRCERVVFQALLMPIKIFAGCLDLKSEKEQHGFQPWCEVAIRGRKEVPKLC